MATKNKFNFSDLTRDELLEKKDELTFEINDIKDQMKAAQINHSSYGVRADAEWFKSATFALRMKQKLQQAVQRELSKRRHVERKNIESQFVEAAREILSKDEFSRIMDLAHDKLEAMG